METYNHATHAMHKNHYPKLLVMAVLSFMAMYALMYTMVDTFANVYPNSNQFYMAALMTAPMVIIEMLLMGSMYKNRKLNLLILAISVTILLTSFFCIRKQVAVGDEQFLKSMIPHHAAAVLMVKETELKDTAIQNLADKIIMAQQKEIEFMKEKLKQMENR